VTPKPTTAGLNALRSLAECQLQIQAARAADVQINKEALDRKSPLFRIAQSLLALAITAALVGQVVQ
jgi:hypothetical protein